MDQRTQANHAVDRIIWACHKILSSKDRTISILKESTLSNVRAIERNSRSVKDPNPLMSTMTNINLKYPITFRKDSIEIGEIPNDLYSGKDNRRYNRIMCKTDLVQWYIHEYKKPIDEDTRKAVITLFESNTKRLKKVFNHNWEQTQFKIGNVSLSRSLVPVNPNVIDIPKELVKPAILQGLGLSNLIEYDNIPEYYLEQIRKIVSDSNISSRKIPSLLNYIQSQIDKKYRYLPILAGLNPEFVYVAHALVQPQYRVSNLMEESSNLRGQNLELTKVCINLIRHCQVNNIPYHKIRELSRSIQINDYPFLKIIENTDENKYTKFIKGVLGMKISPVIEREGLKFYPRAEKLYETTHYTIDQVEFKRLNGEELVYFESNISKGFFYHNADALLTLSINRTTLNELIYVLSGVAVFLTKNFETFRGHTLKQVRLNCKKYYQKNFFEVVGLRQDHIRAIKTELETNSNEDSEIGSLRFSDFIDIVIGDPEEGFLYGNIIKGKSTNQTLSIAPLCSNFESVEDNIKISDPSIYYLMSPKRLLIKAIQYNIKVIGKIKKNIKEGIFEPMFPSILKKYIAVSMQTKISNTFKRILKEKVDANSRDNLFISIFYNFTSGSYQGLFASKITDFRYGRDTISLSLTSGLLQIDASNNLKCGDEIILQANLELSKNQDSYCSILPHFTIRRVHGLIKDVPTKSIEWLSINSNNLDEGFMAVTLFQTNYFLVTKRSDASLQTLKTLQRHIDIGMEEDTSFSFTNYLLKRKIEETDSSSSSGAKRTKIFDASSIIN